MGHSMPLFCIWQQINVFFIKIVYDWIWKRAPWCQKPELCQQCHKHCHFSNNLKKPGIFIVMQTVEHLIAVSRRHKMCFCVSDLWRVPLNCIAFAHLYKSKTGPIIHRWLILSSCFNLVSNLFQVAMPKCWALHRFFKQIRYSKVAKEEFLKCLTMSNTFAASYSSPPSVTHIHLPVEQKRGSN